MSVYYSKQVWALRDPAVKGSLRMVLLCLAEHAGEPGRENDGECWPSQSLVAAETALTVRQVRRALESLAAMGYVAEVASGVGRSRSARFRLTLPVKPDICDSTIPDIYDTPTRKPDIHDTSAVKPDIYANGKPDIHDSSRVKPDIYDTNGAPAARENRTSTTVKPDICAEKSGHPRTKPDICAVKPDIAPHTREEPLEPSEGPSLEPSGEIVGVPPTPPPIHTQVDAIEGDEAAAESWSDFLAAVCWLCYGHEAIGTLTEKQRGALTSEAKTLRDAGTRREHLRHWWHSVWLRDWRWTKNHERPWPSNIRATIAATRDEMAAAAAMTAQAVAQPKPAAGVQPDATPLDATWRVVQMEVLASYPPSSDARRWLAGSRLVEAEPVDDVPLYQVQLASPEGESWVLNRLALPIRRALKSLLGKAVLVEVTAPELEAA